MIWRPLATTVTPSGGYQWWTTGTTPSSMTSGCSGSLMTTTNPAKTFLFGGKGEVNLKKRNFSDNGHVRAANIPIYLFVFVYLYFWFVQTYLFYLFSESWRNDLISGWIRTLYSDMENGELKVIKVSLKEITMIYIDTKNIKSIKAHAEGARQGNNALSISRHNMQLQWMLCKFCFFTWINTFVHWNSKAWN